MSVHPLENLNFLTMMEIADVGFGKINKSFKTGSEDMDLYG